jgi:hypothetical protein
VNPKPQTDVSIQLLKHNGTQFEIQTRAFIFEAGNSLYDQIQSFASLCVNESEPLPDNVPKFVSASLAIWGLKTVAEARLSFIRLIRVLMMPKTPQLYQTEQFMKALL